MSIDNKTIPLAIPETLLQEAKAFYAKMDSDMDQGWQMGRYWVECPDALERCRIAADRLVTALEADNHQLAQLMAGYILSREPQIVALRIDPAGEIQDIEFVKG